MNILRMFGSIINLFNRLTHWGGKPDLADRYRVAQAWSSIEN